MKLFHIKRLQKLRDFLSTIPRKQFDIGVYCQRRECRTVACVAGWAANMPEFRKAGLMIRQGWVYDAVTGLEDTEAFGAFMGLDPEETKNLCFAHGYGQSYAEETKRVTTKMAIAKIDKIIKKKLAERNSDAR